MTVQINEERRCWTRSLAPLRVPSVQLILLLILPLAHNLAEGTLPRTPCPEVFSYRVDPDTNQEYGDVVLQDIHIGQKVRLNIILSIGTVVSQSNFGSIELAKSRDETFRDIYNNQQVQYRVNFPFGADVPNVQTISVNDKTICTGQKAIGTIVTTVNLEHTLFTHNGPNNYPEIQLDIPQYTAPPPMQSTTKLTHSLPQSTTHTVTRPPTTRSPWKAEDSAYHDCGTPASVYNSLSINGIHSPRGQFPWAVPIFDATIQSKPKYICGSTILTERHLVTAAHCMFTSNGIRQNESNLIVVPGMYNIENFFESDLQERTVEKIFIHDDYYFEQSMLVDSDIAVMLLDDPIKYNDVVQPICMWAESDNLEPLVGVKGFMSGWGITENGDAKFPSYVTATVVDRRSCSRNLGKTISGSPRTFCTDGNGSVPCNGDSGSGLVFKRGQKYYIRGIVSFGQFDPETLTCATDKYVVYTDIAPLRYWLSRILKSL